MPISQPVVAALHTALGAEGVPTPLIDRMILASDEMADSYAEGKNRPAELNGSDFAEATFRVLQHLQSGSHTPLNRSLPRLDQLSADLENSQLDDALRIHVPRLMRDLYDVRNRRGVGHLPGPVSANRPDAELVLVIVKWVITEFLRLYSPAAPSDTQALVDTFVVRRPVIVEVFDNEPRIIATGRLSLPDQVLILLHWHEPEHPGAETLSNWLSSKRRADVYQAIRRLNQRSEVHVTGSGLVHLTTLGRSHAEGVMRRHSMV